MNGNCVIAVNKDPNCKTFVGQICSECYNGFFYSQIEAICKRVNPICKTSNLLNGDCTSCYPGYQLNPANGNCEVFFRDPNCQDFSPNGNCLKCVIKYYISSNGKCIPVNPLCKDYNPNNGACTSCYPGYVVKNGGCEVGSAIDPNCKNLQGETCVECFTGYYTQNGKCKQASPLCKTFNPNNGFCTSCYPGYEIVGG